MALPAFHKIRTVAGTTGTSLAVSTPEGASAGDTLHLAIKVEGSAVTIEGPAGWTKVGQKRTEANGGWQAALFELANWNGTTTAYTFTWGGASHGYNAQFLAFSAADTASPRNVTSSEGIRENASSVNAPVQGYTTTVPETLPVTYVWNSAGQSTNPAAGWTEDGDQADGPEAAHKTEGLAAAQTLGTVTHTMVSACVTLTIGCALQPQQAVAVAPPAVPIVAPVIAVRTEPQGGRLALYLRRPDGSQKRVAGDEVAAEDLAQNFAFGTAVPGGFTTASVDFTRDPRVDYGDFHIFDELVAKGPGNEIAFEGYDIEVPKSGDAEKVSLLAAGWSASLKDNPTFQEIYVDRDITRWTAASTSRKIALLAAKCYVNDPAVTNDPGTSLPSLELKLENNWASPWVPLSEAWYDAGPSARIQIIAAQRKASSAGTNWQMYYFVSPETAGFAGGEASPNAAASVAEANDATSFNVAARYGLIQWYYAATPAGEAGASYPAWLRNLIVIGRHGVNYGTPTNPTVLGSDVIANIVSRAAPLLNFTTGVEGSIQPSTFGIPHLIYPAAVTPEEAILQASKYDVPDWGVYEKKQFFWRPSGTGRQWVARESDPGSSVQDVGEQAEDTINGVLIEFNDPSGKSFVVGPPGTPGCDYTDPSLLDTSETNPLNERGRTKLGKIIVAPVTTLAGGIQLGARWLREELAVSARGTAVITGFVQDSYGIYEPVWKMRAGDTVTFDGGRERRIIETQYDHEARTCTLTLDSTPNRVEALMAKMQVELEALGVGS